MPETNPISFKDLIGKYRIKFDGPLTRVEWQARYPQYADIFDEIWKISQESFHSYEPNWAKEVLTENEIRKRVIQIVRAANQERWLEANEATLRLNTEHHVFSRFTSEVKCVNCRKSLWISEFGGIPDNPSETAQLERRRVSRSLCPCPAEKRSWDKFDDTGETLLFQNICEQPVVPDPKNIIDGYPFSTRKPDRVFGLNKTKSFQAYTQDVSDIQRHTPFPGTPVLYPFLIVEAKAGRNGQGFENIEAQTVFPIHTCVMLQEQLKRASGQPLNPLVWFMPYQGDEWRLSACIVQDEQIHIVDLWMGRARSKDGALQLLHIIDYLCEWARFYYRKDILACLAGGWARVHRWSPDRTIRSSTFPSRAPTSMSPVLDQSDERTETASVVDVSMYEPGTFDQILDPEPDDLDIYDDDDQSPLLKWAREDREHGLWPSQATIRHANMIEFRFIHLSLPEDRQTWVKTFRGMRDMANDTIESIARQLLTSLMERTAAMTITLRQIAEVKNEWLKVNQALPPSSRTPVRAWFSFYTDIRSTDWQIFRELWCVSCTSKAAEMLAAMAGLDKAQPRNFIASSKDLYQFSADIVGSIRSVTGRKSVAAALNSKTLYLSIQEGDDNVYHCGWASTTEIASLEVRSLLHLLRDARADPDLLITSGKGCRRMEVFEKPLPEAVTNLFFTHVSAVHGAILLQKGEHWPEGTQQWCLMAVEEVDFDNIQSCGETLFQVKTEGDIYTIVVGGFRHEKNDSHGEQGYYNIDSAFLNQWIQYMMDGVEV